MSAVKMCALCEAKKDFNFILFAGRKIFVINCHICCRPMAFTMDHHPKFTYEEREEVRYAFYKALRLQGHIDWKNKNIFDHANAHLR